ncbi:unnamed protein product [Cuscuta epithymum]|uniref:Uncharacterized protein n=1 Tax=Cuscuta epithymum TaxID=186058 RepID=A0AAV0FPJ9_9ASTE|nr:unnamed protein product [Cuscuta epithymum]
MQVNDASLVTKLQHSANRYMHGQGRLSKNLRELNVSISETTKALATAMEGLTAATRKLASVIILPSMQTFDTVMEDLGFVTKRVASIQTAPLRRTFSPVWKQLSRAIMAARHAKGLCYNCDQEWF